MNRFRRLGQLESISANRILKDHHEDRQCDCNQAAAIQNDADLCGITTAIRLGGQADCAHAQKAEAEIQGGEYHRPQADSRKSAGIWQMAHHGGIDHARQGNR